MVFSYILTTEDWNDDFADKAKGENVVARRRAFYDGKESYNSANYVTLLVGRP